MFIKIKIIQRVTTLLKKKKLKSQYLRYKTEIFELITQLPNTKGYQKHKKKVVNGNNKSYKESLLLETKITSFNAANCHLRFPM